MGSCARHSALIVVAMVAVSTVATVAHADPTAAEKETARRLMEQGRDRLDQKDVTGALEAFRAADEIMHVPTTGLMVATEQASLGMLVEARETLARIARIPRAPDEPDAFKRARKSADELGEKLDARIPSLRFDVRDASGDIAIVVDGAAVSAAVVKVPFKVNPGHHVIVAKAGGSTAKQEVDVREAETKDVVLQLAAVRSQEAPREQAPASEPPSESSGGGNTLAYVGFGVAGVGVVVGSITGALMFSKKSALESGCLDKQCPPAAHDDYSAAYTMATISTVSFIVAGAGAAVGVYGLITRRSSPPVTGAVHVEPWASVGGGGLRGSF